MKIWCNKTIFCTSKRLLINIIAKKSKKYALFSLFNVALISLIKRNRLYTISIFSRKNAHVTWICNFLRSDNKFVIKKNIVCNKILLIHSLFFLIIICEEKNCWMTVVSSKSYVR